jgi:hypothetical protein
MEKAVFAPGGIVIIRCQDWLTKEQREKLRDSLKENFLDATQIVVLEGGLSVEFVSRKN